jgi:hypothetical protein
VVLTTYDLGDEIKKNVMGGACRTCGWREELHRGLWRGNLGERHYLEDPGINGMIILIWIFIKWDG